MENKRIRKVGHTLGDQPTPAVLVDRLPHHYHIVNLPGNNDRMKKLLNFRESMRWSEGDDETHQGATP